MTTWTIRTPHDVIRRYEADEYTVIENALVLYMSDHEDTIVAAYAPGQWSCIERVAETPSVVDERAQTVALIDALQTKLDERGAQIDELDEDIDPDGGLYEDGLRALDAYRGVIDDLHREVAVRWGAAGDEAQP